MANSSRCTAPAVPPFAVVSLYHKYIGLDIIAVPVLIQEAHSHLRIHPVRNHTSFSGELERSRVLGAGGFLVPLPQRRGAMVMGFLAYSEIHSRRRGETGDR